MNGLVADTWVALSNLDPAENLRVAEQVPGLGAVLATRKDQLDPPRTTNGAPIIETSDRGRYVGLVRVALGSDGAAWSPVEAGPLRDLAEERTRVGRLDATGQAAAGTRIAGLRAELDAVAEGRDLVYVEERPLGSDLDAEGPVRTRVERWKGLAVQAAQQRSASKPVVAGYASGAACFDCHTDRFNSWLFDPHARAYDALLPRGKGLDVECVACHTTAWGKPGGNAQLDTEAMRTWKAVQCEACHGPAAGHPEHAEVKPTVPEESTCRGCHDRANSPEFDYARYRARLSCTSASIREREQGDTPKPLDGTVP
jgi:hypothetical protein